MLGETWHCISWSVALVLSRARYVCTGRKKNEKKPSDSRHTQHWFATFDKLYQTQKHAFFRDKSEWHEIDAHGIPTGSLQTTSIPTDGNIWKSGCSLLVKERSAMIDNVRWFLIYNTVIPKMIHLMEHQSLPIPERTNPQKWNHFCWSLTVIPHFLKFRIVRTVLEVFWGIPVSKRIISLQVPYSMDCPYFIFYFLLFRHSFDTGTSVSYYFSTPHPPVVHERDRPEMARRFASKGVAYALWFPLGLLGFHVCGGYRQ